MNSKIDGKIIIIDNSICRHIENIDTYSRGIVSQDVVSDLRHFVEHIIFKVYYGNSDVNIEYETIKKAKDSFNNNRYVFLKKFHKLLQSAISHYKPSEEDSERLMLKYLEYLLMIRKRMKEDYNFELLRNLEKIPLNIDDDLKEYYNQIASKIDENQFLDEGSESSDRFYIHKIKPFFVNQNIYYEISFSPADDSNTKTDRSIAFTNIQIESNYACKMNFTNSNIEIMGCKMPILIISDWVISIRNCEFDNIIKITEGKILKSGRTEKNELCSFMTSKKMNLLDIVLLHDNEYNSTKKILTSKAKKIVFFDTLDKCRHIIRNKLSGHNVLRYLLFTMNNTIIKNQYYISPNLMLSNLYLKNGVIPFDNIPFAFSLISHNPPMDILSNCLEVEEHTPELLARYVKNNAECRGTLFTRMKDLDDTEENIAQLVELYNYKLWCGHRPKNELRIDKDHIFIYSYVSECRQIINVLKEMSSKGISNYRNSVEDWLNDDKLIIDCDEKKNVLKNMFEKSRVAMIYGAAGTGKSTLINYISHFFLSKSKLFLAHTNPAVDNLRRKVTASNCDFMTLTRCINSRRAIFEYDLLIIDECSTVSNNDMIKILGKINCKLLVLVGDNYQIQSIRFGNWFGIARNFLPSTSVVELKKPYRSNNVRIQKIWDEVRTMKRTDNNVLELLTRIECSQRLNSTIFEPLDRDEIILCLNYDGLYGINNINRLLQESNPEKSIEWGIFTFKPGDPILFHESERFSPIIYNNMKGKILDVCIFTDVYSDRRIQFDIEIDKVINGMDVITDEFELIDDLYPEANNSVIRFSVYKNGSTDYDNIDIRTIIPFQISYAVSIHKAQGLEYESVKIVITDEVDELITHNIFYTAITRARSYLRIFWSPEVEKKVLETLEPNSNTVEVSLLYKVSL